MEAEKNEERVATSMPVCLAVEEQQLGKES